MLIDYDHNPSLSVDQKLQSLIESIQRCLDSKADNEKIIELQKKLSEIQNN